MIDRIAVVVPAANEEELIGACLTAVGRATAQVAVPVRVVVVLDRCTDATALIASQHPGVEIVAVDVRNVGRARCAGAAVALAGCGDPSGLLIASTDADSRVPADWLGRLADLAATADLVLGTVVPDVGLPKPVEEAWFAEHDLRDGHPHVHAANLAVRGDAYLTLGGWPPLTSGEDEVLVRRATAQGLRIVRTASVPVVTSVRPSGRAPGGFSSYLRALGQASN